MKLLFLHGAPATGKYTVGREIAALTQFELYHNHTVVDDVLQRHDFGTPEFVAERDAAWRQHLVAAASAGKSGLIFTFNPEDTVPQSFIDWLFGEFIASTRTELHSIEFVASDATIETRLATEDRRAFRKLTDLKLYRYLRETGAFRAPAIPRSDLRVDTELLAPADAARLITERFVRA